MYLFGSASSATEVFVCSEDATIGADVPIPIEAMAIGAAGFCLSDMSLISFESDDILGFFMKEGEDEEST